MKAIWLRQPWATLVAIGVKEWETRSAPPNGPMRPDGVRGMPGLAIEPGERIAIVASKAKPKHCTKVGAYDVFVQAGEAMLYDAPAVRRDGFEGRRHFHPLPLGVVVCTVVVAEALPIVDGIMPAGYSPTDERPPIWNKRHRIAGWAEELYRTNPAGGPPIDISDQFPYGDWSPGRWAWRLTDVEPVTGRHEPVVIRGNRQGVCEIEETWT